MFLTSFWFSFTSGIRDDPAAMYRLKHGCGSEISGVLKDIKKIKLNSEVIVDEIKEAEEKNHNSGSMDRTVPVIVWQPYPDLY